MALQSSTLSFTYPGERAALRFPALTLAEGESALVLGASGVGKSTFLHLLAGLQSPSEGEIRIRGEALHQLRGEQRARFRARHIGMVFQRHYFLPYLSLAENLRLATQLQGNPVSEKEILHSMEELSIAAIAHKKPGQCSQGEQQRASIARALLQKPALILADEPTAALDDQNSEKVAKLLLALSQKQGSALVIVTHDARLRHHIPKHLAL